MENFVKEEKRYININLNFNPHPSGNDWAFGRVSNFLSPSSIIKVNY